MDKIFNVNVMFYKPVIFSVLLVFLLVLGTSTPTLATSVCADTNTSYYSTNITVSGSTIPISYNTTCSNGCNTATGECNLTSFDSSNYILFLIFPIIAFVLLYFVSILKSEDWAIHLLLMIAALAFLVAPLGILQGMQEQANNAFLGIPLSGLYMFLVVIMIIVIFYYLLKVIVGAIRLMEAKKKGGVNL